MSDLRTVLSELVAAIMAPDAFPIEIVETPVGTDARLVENERITAALRQARAVLQNQPSAREDAAVAESMAAENRRLRGEIAEARAQLAALHVACVVLDNGRRICRICRRSAFPGEPLGHEPTCALADLAAAAAEHDARVRADEHDARARAPVEAERDQFAAALAEVMTPRGIYDAWSLNRVLRRLADAADHLLNDHSCDRHGYEGVVCARDAARDHAAAIEKLSIPADLAAQREVRIRADERAKALREAADDPEVGLDPRERLRAMADEAERGTR